VDLPAHKIVPDPVEMIQAVERGEAVRCEGTSHRVP
jgi:hypothetical protein